MKKEITYLELLQMVKDGKQPKKIYFNGQKFIFKDSTYKIMLPNELPLFLTHVIKSYLECELATDKLFLYEEDILDEKEKEYLKAVIKPFRNRVRYIVKGVNTGFASERLVMNVYWEDGEHWDTFALPSFNKDTMYKGMEQGKEYTIEELGI